MLPDRQTCALMSLRLRQAAEGRSDRQDVELVALELDAAANGFFTDSPTTPFRSFARAFARARQMLRALPEGGTPCR